jgi:trimethylamine--corrinoid protein Co-methyltransferase
MTTRRVVLELLHEDELRQIEETALRILDEVGIALEHDRAREMLHGLGCRVEGHRVYIPPHVVQWTLQNVTPHREEYTPDGKLTFRFGDGAIRFHNSGGPPFVIDLETGERRPATMQDVGDITRLLDALEHVDVITPLFGPQDVPAEIMELAATAAMLKHTRKPVSAAAVENPADVPYMVQMAQVLCGGEEAFRRHPTMSISVSPVSPLTFTEKVTAAIMAVAEAGAPFHSLPAPSLGATGPITLAGALAQQHAEVLASFVLVAAVRPGAPVTYCSRINPIDLRTAVSSWGGPEVGLAGACAVQLAHRLGLTCDTYGLCSSADRVDAQFAYERFANAVMPALAGADIMSGVGGIASGLAGGYEIAVIDNEMISLLKRLVQGCEVNQDTLAFDVIREVVRRDGVFLGEPHTVLHMRRGEIWMPGISERRTGAGDESAVGVLARAQARAREILQTHVVEPWPAEALRQLDEILTRARRERLGE